LALGHAVDDVEQDDVAQFLEPDQVGEGSADIASPDQGDLVASHVILLGSRGFAEPGATIRGRQSGRVNSAKRGGRQPSVGAEKLPLKDAVNLVYRPFRLAASDPDRDDAVQPAICLG